jgi:hypothetical protein
MVSFLPGILHCWQLFSDNSDFGIFSRIDHPRRRKVPQGGSKIVGAQFVMRRTGPVTSLVIPDAQNRLQNRDLQIIGHARITALELHNSLEATTRGGLDAFFRLKPPCIVRRLPCFRPIRSRLFPAFVGARATRRILKFALAIFVVVAATACLPVTTSSPIVSAGSKPDPLLAGMWKGKVGESRAMAYLTFFPQSDGTLKIVMLMPPATNEDGGWMVFQARSVTLGPYQYLDARQIDDGGKAPDARLAHIPVLYHVSGDDLLVLYLIDDAAAREAIQKGDIAGTIEQGEYGDVAITAGPGALDAFLGSDPGRALFKKSFAVLERVK